MVLLWNVATGKGLVKAIRQARVQANSSLPIVSHYTLASTHLMKEDEDLPEGASEEWFLHCQNPATTCTGQRTPECRCRPLFDLSLAKGANFNTSDRVMPNPASINPQDPEDDRFRQNWQAAKEAQVFATEPFDAKSLDMFIFRWSYALILEGKSYLATPVESTYKERVKHGKAYLDLLRAHFPPGTLLFANGGQADMSLGRFLPVYESEIVPVRFKKNPVAVNGRVLPEFWDWAVQNFTIFKGPAYMEWWEKVGQRLDGTGADGWLSSLSPPVVESIAPFALPMSSGSQASTSPSKPLPQGNSWVLFPMGAS